MVARGAFERGPQFAQFRHARLELDLGIGQDGFGFLAQLGQRAGDAPGDPDRKYERQQRDGAA